MKMKRIFYIVLIVSVLASCGRKEEFTAYAAGDGCSVETFCKCEKGKITSQSHRLARGQAFTVCPEKVIRQDGFRYLLARIGKERFYVEESSVAATVEECVREKEIFVQTAASLIDDTLSSHICDFAKKGRKLEVTGFDKILNVVSPMPGYSANTPS